MHESVNPCANDSFAAAANNAGAPVVPDERAALERRLLVLQGEIKALIDSDLPDSELEGNWEDLLKEAVILRRRQREIKE